VDATGSVRIRAFAERMANWTSLMQVTSLPESNSARSSSWWMELRVWGKREVRLVASYGVFAA
jgi:hypothetical protein